MSSAPSKLVIFVAAATILCGQAPSFDVASIKLATGQPDRSGPRQPVQTSPTSLTMTFVSVSECIWWAYGVQEFQITGARLPEGRFHIAAKTANTVTKQELRVMLQTLLADRFQLAFHRDSKTMSVYALTAGKNIHLDPAEGEGDMSAQMQPPATMLFRHTTMFELAALLSDSLRTPVIDETGIVGRMNFKIDASRYIGSPPVNNDGLSGEGAMFFAAVEQLGLKFERRKAPVDVLVIDRAEKPTEN